MIFLFSEKILNHLFKPSYKQLQQILFDCVILKIDFNRQNFLIGHKACTLSTKSTFPSLFLYTLVLTQCLAVSFSPQIKEGTKTKGRSPSTMFCLMSQFYGIIYRRMGDSKASEIHKVLKEIYRQSYYARVSSSLLSAFCIFLECQMWGGACCGSLGTS